MFARAVAYPVSARGLQPTSKHIRPLYRVGLEGEPGTGNCNRADQDVRFRVEQMPDWFMVVVVGWDDTVESVENPLDGWAVFNVEVIHAEQHRMTFGVVQIREPRKSVLQFPRGFIPSCDQIPPQLFIAQSRHRYDSTFSEPASHTAGDIVRRARRQWLGMRTTQQRLTVMGHDAGQNHVAYPQSF